MPRKAAKTTDIAVGPNHYSQLPSSVLLDPEISSSTKCVYAFIAGSGAFSRSEVHVSQNSVVLMLRMHRTTVMSAIADLERHNHLEILRERGRGWYRLTSPVFAYRPGRKKAGEEEE